MRLLKSMSWAAVAMLSVQLTRAADYLVVDLAEGATATNYAVTYLDSVPAGGWTDEYKTTKLVMRKIPKGTFTMGSPTNELGRQSNENQHQVTLSQDFYVCVFEVTQKQWERVMGNWPSFFSNASYRETRPVEQVSYNDIRGFSAGAGWPGSSAVDATSFMGMLRSKTGLATIDLPTEAQWEYACRAGTATALNSGKNLTGAESCSNMAEVGRYLNNGGSAYTKYGDTSVGSAKVGSFQPNVWGLYDMHGNEWELCLDWWSGSYTDEVTDPKGPSNGSLRVARGGAWDYYASGARSAFFAGYHPPAGRGASIGFRAVWTLAMYPLSVVGGTGSGDLSSGTVTNVAADVPVAGQVFAHWSVSPEEADLGAGFAATQPSTTVIMPGYDVTLTAVFEAGKYSVRFDARGGTVDPAEEIVTYGLAYGSMPAPSRAGYAFDGWWTEAEGAGIQISEGSAVEATSDHTLYAKWTAKTYTVTFEAEGGNVSPVWKRVTFGGAYGALPSPSRGGYVFDGWWTGDGARTRVTAETLVTALADHALYAVWVEDPLLCPPADSHALSSLGLFDGFFYSEDTDSGMTAKTVRGTLKLSVSSLTGKLTAKAVMQKSSLSFSAAQWTATETDGTCRAMLTTRRGETLDLYVRQNRIWGSMTGGTLGGDVFTLDGARNRFFDRADVAAQTMLKGLRGYYTVALPVYDALSLDPLNVAPEGSGYLTVTIGEDGKAKIAGVLADGTHVSQASQLILFDGCGPAACVPFFTPLHARSGWAGGLLWIDPASRTVVTDRDLGWFIRWEKPGTGSNAFSMLLDACGGIYSPAQGLASHYRFSAVPADVSDLLNGGDTRLLPVFPTDIGVAVNGTRMAITKGIKPELSNGTYNYAASENSSMATLVFTATTGLFKGKFNLYYDHALNGKVQHKTVSVPYVGVLTPVRSGAFADQPAGQGSYLVPDNDDPALSRERTKRSFRVELKAAP